MLLTFFRFFFFQSDVLNKERNRRSNSGRRIGRGKRKRRRRRKLLSFRRFCQPKYSVAHTSPKYEKKKLPTNLQEKKYELLKPPPRPMEREKRGRLAGLKVELEAIQLS
jgi:hypothetical protein